MTHPAPGNRGPVRPEKSRRRNNMNYIHRGLKSVSYQWNGKQWKAKFYTIGSPQNHSGLYNTREELQADINAWLD
jgi:5-keto 4-deoxyuronate isomerase